MKFIVFFACVAAAASAENARADPRIFGLIGSILDILRPSPVVDADNVGNNKPSIFDHIAVGPAIIEQHEPIHVGPAIIDGFEPIHVGPAIIDGFEPIHVGPAIIDQLPIQPSPALPPVYPSPVPSYPVLGNPGFPFPSFSSPLVQLIVNVKSGSDVAGSPVVIDSMPEIIASPAIVDPEVVAEAGIIASPAIVDPEVIAEAGIIASPAIVDPEVVAEAGIIASPAIVDPEVVAEAGIIASPAIVDPEVIAEAGIIASPAIVDPEIDQ